MQNRCSHSDLKYQKEPSFFYGAMYGTYALTSGWLMLWLVLYLTVLPNMETLLFAVLLALAIVMSSTLTLRHPDLL